LPAAIRASAYEFLCYAHKQTPIYSLLIASFDTMNRIFAPRCANRAARRAAHPVNRV
jgi:hypothetical protein